MKRSLGWKDLPLAVRITMIAAAAVQVTLLGIAHADLSRRSEDELRGRRGMWRMLTLINFVGPIAYFAVGRKQNSH